MIEATTMSLAVILFKAGLSCFLGFAICAFVASVCFEGDVKKTPRWLAATGGSFLIGLFLCWSGAFLVWLWNVDRIYSPHLL